MCKIQERAEKAALNWWNMSRRIFAEFGDIGEMPIIIINRRLTSTAGRAFLDDGKIDLSEKITLEDWKETISDTIPHELAHHIAFRLWGEERHGYAWKFSMRKLGLKPNIYRTI